MTRIKQRMLDILARRAPLALPHLYQFGDSPGASLRSAAAWDRLRHSHNEGFVIPTERDEWVRAAQQRTDLAERARRVAALVDKLEGRSLASYGVGVAHLEFHIATVAPDIRLLCSDFAPRSVAKLSEIFPEAEIHHHDLRAGPLPADVHLMHRIDTEFTTRQWRLIFRTFDGPIIFIPAGLLNATELRTAIASLRSARRATWSGYSRTLPAMLHLWKGSGYQESLAVDGLEKLYLLQRRDRNP